MIGFDSVGMDLFDTAIPLRISGIPLDEADVGHFPSELHKSPRSLPEGPTKLAEVDIQGEQTPAPISSPPPGI